MTLLEKLTTAIGLPGLEDEVRDLIKAELEGIATVREDRMGNLIAVKNPDAQGPHIALSAHMDEVGLCVRHINGDGSIKFASWGVDSRILPSMRVLVGTKKVPGVIGTKPIHLQQGNERGSVLGIDQLSIDIGCENKGAAEGHAAIGDFIAFDSKFTEFGDGKIKAKALDDRVGCAAIIEMLKMDYPGKITGIFCVQEEIGLRGSAVTAKGLQADLLINIEGTIGADMYDVPEHEHVTTQGAGPALSLIDRATIYPRKYLDEMVRVAEANNIPYQYRRTSSGGTDAGNYHLAGEGMPVIGVAVPCRYLHSPVSVMDKRDYENLLLLLSSFIRKGQFV